MILRIEKKVKKILVVSSLVFVISCAGFSYKFYGVDTGSVDTQTLNRIKLIAGKRGDSNKSLAQFQTKPSDETAKLICTPVEEFRLMRQAILECEGK